SGDQERIDFNCGSGRFGDLPHTLYLFEQLASPFAYLGADSLALPFEAWIGWVRSETLLNFAEGHFEFAGVTLLLGLGEQCGDVGVLFLFADSARQILWR